MHFSLLLALLATDPAPAQQQPAPSRGPLKRKLDPAAVEKGESQAADLLKAMTANKVFDGRFTVLYDKLRGRVIVSLFGTASVDHAKSAITEAVSKTPGGIPDDFIIRFVICGDPGRDLVRRENGKLIDLSDPGKAITAGDFFAPDDDTAKKFNPCSD